LERQLLRRTVITAAERNQAIHARSLAATAGIATVISTMDAYTLWWVSQWVKWRDGSVAAPDTSDFRSYKDWVRKTGAKAKAGMEGGGTVPQTV